MKTEVLIIGAGPVGLTLAAELARYGVAVRVFDKSPQRTQLSKAIVVWSRTLELLDRAGCGSALVSAGLQVAAANIAASGKSIGRIEFGGVDTTHPYALMLPQCETERLLEEHLNHMGVKLERGVELLSFVDSGASVMSTLRHADGREEKVESAWMVGCDGARSKVRDGLRKVFTGDAQPSSWIIGDVHLDGLEPSGEAEIDWHADGVLAIFPITRERCRVIADVGPSETDKNRPEPTLEDIQTVLTKRGRGSMTASDPQWLGSFHINERQVAEYSAGRVFLAGDSAHVYSPAGGQGMNTGMQDAINLAWKLALVCRHMCAEEPLLGSYSLERSAVGAQVLKNTGRITSLAILRGDVKQSIRNHLASMVFGFAPIRNAMVETIAEISFGYPNSPLSRRGSRVPGAPGAGARAPVREGETPFGAGGTPRFALCADATDETAKRAGAVMLGLYKHLLEPEFRAPFAKGGIWLVRPDGYIAVATGLNGWDEVAAHIDKIVGRLSTSRVEAVWSSSAES